MNATNEYSDIISKINDAKEAVSKESNKLTKRREELIRELANVDAKILRLKDIVPTSFEVDEPVPVTVVKKSSVIASVTKSLQAAVDRNKRNQAIIDIATELGEKNRHNRFFVVEVAAELVKERIKMGIPENRYNSVISRLLSSKSERFELKNSGRFKLIKKDGA